MIVWYKLCIVHVCDSEAFTNGTWNNKVIPSYNEVVATPVPAVISRKLLITSGKKHWVK